MFVCRHCLTACLTDGHRSLHCERTIVMQLQLLLSLILFYFKTRLLGSCDDIGWQLHPLCLTFALILTMSGLVLVHTRQTALPYYFDPFSAFFLNHSLFTLSNLVSLFSHSLALASAGPVAILLIRFDCVCKYLPSTLSLSSPSTFPHSSSSVFTDSFQFSISIIFVLFFNVGCREVWCDCIELKNNHRSLMKGKYLVQESHLLLLLLQRAKLRVVNRAAAAAATLLLCCAKVNFFIFSSFIFHQAGWSFLFAD